MKVTVYAKGKRAKEGKLNKKKVAICIIFFIAIIITSYFSISNRLLKMKGNLKEEEITEVSENNEVIEENIVQEQQEEQTVQDEVSDAEIPEKMGGYNVLGQLVIEKIGVNKNILAISENESLKLSVAKLYGPDLNEAGNFCIDGHNWTNMLKRLSEMQVGDTFYAVNRKTKTKVNYKIYKIYTCVPEDLSCLDQNHDGKREITLITCNPGGLTRLICKARET